MATQIAVAATLTPTVSRAQSTEAQAGREPSSVAMPPVEGPSTLSETYRDWVVRCSTTADGARPCEMAQELRQADSRLVFAALVRAVSDESATAIFIAPFGLSLADGITLEREGLAVDRLPFRTCYATGCIVEFPLDAETVAALSEGGQLGVGMTALAGGNVEVSLSLEGFGAALARLRALSP